MSHVSLTRSSVCPRAVHALFKKVLAGDAVCAVHGTICQGLIKANTHHCQQLWQCTQEPQDLAKYETNQKNCSETYFPARVTYNPYCVSCAVLMVQRLLLYKLMNSTLLSGGFLAVFVVCSFESFTFLKRVVGTVNLFPHKAVSCPSPWIHQIFI